MRQVLRSPRALRDLEDLYVYIALDSPSSADRFLASAEHTFRFLAQFPGAGRPWRSRRRRLRGVRWWPVDRFRSILAFYRDVGDAIEILHVIHGARDRGPAIGDA